MDKRQAKDLVKSTLENQFDKVKFTFFVKNLLNKIDESKAFHARGYVPESYKKYVKTYERLATYTDPDNLKIDILIVYLQSETTLERARTSQRNFIAHYLKDRDQKDAGLVAFVSPDPSDWRFSLVKMDYKIDEKGKVKEDFTPARRWSFLVGANENSHTAQSRLAPLIADDVHNPALAELEEAFNIETVTKEFFTEYRNLFLRVKEALDAIVAHDATIKSNFDQNGVNTVDFAKKLLGQIVFLYFLQKKGWFGVARDAQWGTGSKQFLRELFDKKHGGYQNFFNDVLEPLFYDALSRDRSDIDHWNDHFKCKIPFLNGGLFDPISGYDWVKTDILISNELFSNMIRMSKGDEGDGILDVFDRYNFTVKEDEPLEKEVAIDPELLGKAYEKFNAIRPDNFAEFQKALKSGKKGEESKFNKQFGVYYTPREIVHYMCQQSLINYLATELSAGHSGENRNPAQTVIAGAAKQSLAPSVIPAPHAPGVTPAGIQSPSKEDIETLIHYGETLFEHDSIYIEKISNDPHYKGKYDRPKLPKSIEQHAKLIDDKLSGIKVCDPAIGSGAFPVGMMSEIVRARNTLSTFIRNTDRSNYHFKRECIENSLYGVDIDSGAVEIAKLRLWLSLVVDEDDIRQIKPLPNLDYKIVCGNSLLGVEKNLFNNELFEKLEKFKPLYFNETNPTKKQEYKKQIDDLIKQITNGHTEFDFEVYFSEVFHEKDGFDVVIANPPYVRADNPKFKEQRKAIMASNYYKTLYEKWDLFVPFIEKGLNLLNANGFECYITSNSLLTSKFAFKILEYIQAEFVTQFIDYFDDAWVFDAGVIPVIFGVSHTVTQEHVVKKIHTKSFENISLQEDVPIASFKKIGKDAFRQLSNKFELKIRTLALGSICYISYGLRPNSDERFWKGEFTRADLVSETKDHIHCMPYVEGKNIEAYNVNKILFLEWGTKRVPKKLVRPTFQELYNRPKILRGRVTGGIYDETGLICNDSIVVFVRFIDLQDVQNRSITGSITKFNDLSRAKLENISKNFDLKYLLAILNSRYAYYCMNSIRRHRLENYFYPDDYRNIPIADINLTDQESFIAIVDKILTLTKSYDYQQNPAKQAKVKEYEKEIDQMVYKLYGLTEEEIKIVEGKNE